MRERVYDLHFNVLFFPNPIKEFLSFGIFRICLYRWGDVDIFTCHCPPPLRNIEHYHLLKIYINIKITEIRIFEMQGIFIYLQLSIPYIYLKNYTGMERTLDCILY